MKSDRDMKVTNSRCKCSGCDEYFNSLSAFEAHRKGDYGNEGKNRYCDTSKMFKNSSGYWVTSLKSDSDRDVMGK